MQVSPPLFRSILQSCPLRADVKSLSSNGQSSQVQTLLPGASDPSRTRAVQAAEDEEEEEDESEEDQLPRRFEGRGNGSVQEVQIDMSSMSRPRSTSSSTNAKGQPNFPHVLSTDPVDCC
jgi:hypothetical protein